MNNELFQVLATIAGAVGGWTLKTFWSELKALQKADARLVEKLAAVEVLVAGEYARRDEIERLSAALFNKLDRIEAKLDTKVDK